MEGVVVLWRGLSRLEIETSSFVLKSEGIRGQLIPPTLSFLQMHSTKILDSQILHSPVNPEDKSCKLFSRGIKGLMEGDGRINLEGRSFGRGLKVLVLHFKSQK
jgi:hypothetical protein